MKWVPFFCGILAVSSLSLADEVTGHTVLLQPIILCDDDGNGGAKASLPENLIDLPFRRWDIDFHILEPLDWAKRRFRDGEVNVDEIVKAAKEEGVFREPGRIANMFFAKKINGKAAPNGLGQQPGWVTFIAQGNDPPPGQDAFVVVHEVTHNLGLAHAVDDDDVPGDIPNVMGDGDFLDRIREDGITRHQAATILKSPLVRETVRCLQGDEAREGYLDESMEPYYAGLNRREIEAMTGEVLPKDLSDEEVVAETRKRYAGAVLDFTGEEREMLLWMADQYRRILVKDFPLLANQPWQMIKVNRKHCSGFCHTRGLSVVLSESMIDRMSRDFREHGKTTRSLTGAGTVLVHEQLHVLQRCFPKKFADLYTKVYGLIDGVIAEDDWIAENEISNPDGLEGNRWVVEIEGKYYWPKTILDVDDKPARMPGSFREEVVSLTKKGNSFQSTPVGESGRPVQADLEAWNGWKEQFPIRVGHDHPNEISAYLFQGELVRLLTGEKPSEDPMTFKTMEWCRRELR